MPPSRAPARALRRWRREPGARSAPRAAVVTRIAGGAPRRNRLPGRHEPCGPQERSDGGGFVVDRDPAVEPASAPRATTPRSRSASSSADPPGVVAARPPDRSWASTRGPARARAAGAGRIWLTHPAPRANRASIRLMVSSSPATTAKPKVGSVSLRRRSQEGPVTRAADDRPEGRGHDAVAVVVLEDGHLGVGAQQGAQLAAAALADRRARWGSERGRSARRLGSPGRAPVPGRRGPAPRRRPRAERGRSPLAVTRSSSAAQPGSSTATRSPGPRRETRARSMASSVPKVAVTASVGTPSRASRTRAASASSARHGVAP